MLYYSAFIEFLFFLTSPSYNSQAFLCFFFFQAEDGIRDADVTGVQTCALPIYDTAPTEIYTLCLPPRELRARSADERATGLVPRILRGDRRGLGFPRALRAGTRSGHGGRCREIGRAACRERG